MAPDARGGYRAGVTAALAMLVWMFAARDWLGVLTPLELVADQIVPRIPLELFRAGIEALGGYAKIATYAVGLVLTLLLGGALGGAVYRLAAGRGARRLLAGDGIAVLGLLLLTGLVLLPLAGDGPFGAASGVGAGRTVLYYLIAYLLYAVVLALPALETSVAPADAGRRRLLRGGGLLLVLAAVGPVLVRAVQGMTVTNLDRAAEGMPKPITPVGPFYNVSKNAFDPRVDAETWRLRIGGMVETPFELTLDEIRALPPVEKLHTLQCISNPVGGNLIGNGDWTGVRLRDLLDRAGVRDGVIDIKIEAEDGYVDSIPLPKAMEEGALLAYEMNGAPLTYKHGAPLRLLVPNIYGMKNVKWITGIEAVGEDVRGYWQRQGWSDVATYQIMSQVRVPKGDDRLSVGQPVQVGGIAFAGSRGIGAVEWSADAGETWRAAELLRDMGKDTWRFWQAAWTPDFAGEYALTVRATDGDGTLQTRESAPTLPDGATGYHSITVRVAAAAV